MKIFSKINPWYQKNIVNHSCHVTYCSSLQPMVVYNFSKTKSTFLTQFGDYVTNCQTLLGMVSICFRGSPFHVFSSIQKLLKIIQKKLCQSCAKQFNDLTKDFYFLKFPTDSRKKHTNFFVCYQNIFLWAENFKEHRN